MNLTTREVEVLKLMCEGNTAKNIAAKLSLSSRTVGSHRWKIFKKVGCTSNAQLGAWAVRNGIA